MDASTNQYPPFSTRTLNDVIDRLRQADGRSVFLTGAGTSKSAGIPLASGLIAEIKRDFPTPYERACKRALEKKQQLPTYNQVMSELPPTQRKNIFLKHIANAKINWAHLALAHMFANKKMERILTVNFDSLIPRACALVNLYPPIYDLATTNSYRSELIAPQSLIYLNGQSSGFVMLNAAEELAKHRTNLQRMVTDTGVNQVWVVVGYSGESDPLLDALAEVKSFDGELYWLGHDPLPPQHLLDKNLFAEGKYAFYVGGQDADLALSTIAIALESFPPKILTTPSVFIEQVIGQIDFATGKDLGKNTAKNLDDLLTGYKQIEAPSAHVARVDELIMQNKLIEAETLLTSPSPNALTDKENNALTWTYVLKGNDAYEQAQVLKDSDPAEAKRLWTSAYAQYEKALNLKQDMHEAAYNWGIALAAQAQALKDSDPAEAKRLWTSAYAQYEKALSIKPDKHEAAYNWGSTLDDQAQALKDSDPAEAKRLWARAYAQYEKALSIKPDKHEAASNWGNALLQQVAMLETMEPKLAAGLLNQALKLLEKHSAQSLAAKEAVAYNMACVLARMGQYALAIEYLDINQHSSWALSKEHIELDVDLALLRETAEFKAWRKVRYGG